jgi:hypothetical protein
MAAAVSAAYDCRQFPLRRYRRSCLFSSHDAARAHPDKYRARRLDAIDSRRHPQTGIPAGRRENTADNAGPLRSRGRYKRDLKFTGAKVLATESDAPVLEDGGKSDPFLGPAFYFAPVQVHRKLKHGDLIKLGDTQLPVIFTPGHTRGSVVMPLMGNTKYPRIADDLARSFDKTAAAFAGHLGRGACFAIQYGCEGSKKVRLSMPRATRTRSSDSRDSFASNSRRSVRRILVLAEAKRFASSGPLPVLRHADPFRIRWKRWAAANSAS